MENESVIISIERFKTLELIEKEIENNSLIVKTEFIPYGVYYSYFGTDDGIKEMKLTIVSQNKRIEDLISELQNLQYPDKKKKPFWKFLFSGNSGGPN